MLPCAPPWPRGVLTWVEAVHRDGERLTRAALTGRWRCMAHCQVRHGWRRSATTHGSGRLHLCFRTPACRHANVLECEAPPFAAPTRMPHSRLPVPPLSLHSLHPRGAVCRTRVLRHAHRCAVLGGGPYDAARRHPEARTYTGARSAPIQPFAAADRPWALPVQWHQPGVYIGRWGRWSTQTLALDLATRWAIPVPRLQLVNLLCF